MPQKEMRQHACEHVVMPSRIFAEFVMVHSQFGFRLRTALFHGPAQTTQPYQEAQRGTPRGIAHVVPRGGFFPERTFDHSPDGLGWRPILPQPYPLARKLIRNRAFGPL